MKILYMGTPAPAAKLLSDLLKTRKDIVSVVTQPDKQKGRGLKNSESEVAQISKAAGITTYKPASVKDPEFIETIKNLAPDLIIVVAYGKILPKEFLDIPKLGCINVHASLLPKYRGASPIQAALLNGDKTTGITIMMLNEKMDEGDVLAQEEVSIQEDDNVTSLSDRLFIKGASLLTKTLVEADDNVRNGLKPFLTAKPQNRTLATYAPLIKKEDGLLDFSQPAEKNFNKIRAYDPWPGAFTKFNGKVIKILKAELKDGQLIIKEVQPEGSRRMTAEEFERGYRVKMADIIAK